MWLIPGYHEIESGAGIKKSASRIAKQSVWMAGWHP